MPLINPNINADGVIARLEHETNPRFRRMLRQPANLLCQCPNKRRDRIVHTRVGIEGAVGADGAAERDMEIE